MRIGNLEFENNVFLAPMAGVTDSAFRRICNEEGCGMVTTEMVSAKGLYYKSENTEELLAIREEEKPVAVQTFGREPFIMAKAAEKFQDDDRFCIIDINMGCPAPKIVKNGEGSALLKEPKLAQEIVREMKKATEKPVTVKFRIGFENGHNVAVDFAKYMEEAGADSIAIHGRTREQMYSGDADWETIAKAVEAVSIPVIGNGDIDSYEKALAMFKMSKCDGIMIARATRGNPFIFREINEGFRGREVSIITDKEKLDVALRHLDYAVESLGEYKAVVEMRKHFGWYLKGMQNSIDIKNVINKTTDLLEVVEVIKQYQSSLM